MGKPLFVLASKSPRRKELLKNIGISAEIIPANVDESVLSDLPPERMVTELALLKASDVARSMRGDTYVIGADTVVVCDGEIMGKPKDKDDAFRMLKKLSGKAHSVYTGITLIWNDGSKKSFAEETKVFVSNLSDREIKDYIKTNECWDKAGSYAIQGLFSIHIEKIEGDYNNVVGFPVARIYKELTGK